MCHCSHLLLHAVLRRRCCRAPSTLYLPTTRALSSKSTTCQGTRWDGQTPCHYTDPGRICYASSVVNRLIVKLFHGHRRQKHRHKRPMGPVGHVPSNLGERAEGTESAPRSRQITTPAPHHSVFYRPDALPAAQPTASKH